MTLPPARRPGPPDPGTFELPAVQPSGGRSGPPPDDTGPIPIVGARPVPPPPPPPPPPPARRPVPLPESDLTEELPPVTEEAPTPTSSGRAGRNLGAAIGVGLGLGAVIIASLLVYRPAFLL